MANILEKENMIVPMF